MKAKGESYTFTFSTKNGKQIMVEYNTSKTMFGTLNEIPAFSSQDKKGKEIIIRRSKGKIAGAVVKTDFPCCLIEDGENFNINFYNSEFASTNQETTTDTDPQSLVIFYIRTRGNKVKKIMKSSVFVNKNIDYVCVFAHKGDILKEALQRDGRFIDNTFDHGSELIDDGGTSYKMNLTVDHCHDKKFELNIISAGKKPKNCAKNNGKPKNTEEKTMQEIKTKVTDPSVEDHAAQNNAENSGDLESGDSGNSFSTDVTTILKTLFENVFKELQEQTHPQVQKFIQEEYDKGVQCFTEVNKVRRIMELSNSVCVIMVEESPRGTGFLLFDRFILTNAHVVKEYICPPTEDPHRRKVFGTWRAAFNFEVLGHDVKILPVKSDLVAYGYEKDDQLRQQDFALLELDTVKPENCTELLSCYRHVRPPKSGGIYIVGHPDCGVKKMDPCFIIGIENQLQSINNHISNNISCPYVSWQCWPYLYKNQITYDSCFFHGSSGSPVFDEHCYLIGIHTGGFHYDESGKTRSVIEYSYSMQPILESIITQVEKRSDILKLLTKFESIKAIFELGNIEDTSGANMHIKEEQQSEKAEETETN